LRTRRMRRADRRPLLKEGEGSFEKESSEKAVTPLVKISLIKLHGKKGVPLESTLGATAFASERKGVKAILGRKKKKPLIASQDVRVAGRPVFFLGKTLDPPLNMERERPGRKKKRMPHAPRLRRRTRCARYFGRERCRKRVKRKKERDVGVTSRRNTTNS